MNTRKVARLLRDLADELDPANDDVPEAEPSKPRRRAERKVARPAGESDDLSAMQAKKLLRQNGWRDR